MRQGGESRAAACADWLAQWAGDAGRAGTQHPGKLGYQNLDIKNPCEEGFLRRKYTVTI
jgi:hypothetical protein